MFFERRCVRTCPRVKTPSAMLRKIFPFDAESSFFNSFTVLFLSEGFQASESGLFTSLCLDFTNRLLETAPFNLTRINSNWLSIYTSFVASNHKGPLVNGTAAANRTAFESTIDTNTGLMTFNPTKVNDHITGTTFIDNEATHQLTNVIGKGSANMGLTGTLVVLLLPPTSSYPEGGDFESPPHEDNYNFIATTADGYWHQVVIRGMCKLLGLGDEYELPGDDKFAPDDDEQNALLGFPNLQYFESPPGSVNSNSKWFKLFSLAKQGTAADVVPKSGDTSLPDTSIDNRLVSYHEPKFYEGGGGFRTKVYRSCQDALMRRRIGSTDLPLRKTLLSLDPISIHFLKGIIL